MKIGITGGIGSGKSYVCRMLRERGIPVYDCDAEAKRLMATDAEIHRRLTALLGTEAYKDGAPNKTLIASFLFASPENAASINDIVHPVVKDDFLRWAAGRKEKAVGMECAILFESGFADAVDFTVVVDAPLPVRIRRAMTRDNASEESIRRRISSQMDDGLRKASAGFVIENDGIRPLPEQIDRLIEIIRKQTT